MYTDRCFLIGAGGHAKVVYDSIQLMGIEFVDVWDDCIALSGCDFLGCTVKAPILLDGLVQWGIVAIGDNHVRRQLSENLDELNRSKLIVIHPAASISKYANIGGGSFIAARSVVGAGSCLGEGVIVNHGAVVDHDCIVRAFSHIAPNATLGGHVSIGEGCLIGAGAVVLPGTQIADGVTVGAGSVVISNILTAGETVYGVPVK